MTNFIEEQLTEGMRERVAGLTITTDLVGQAVRGQRRRTVITRTAYAVGIAGLAGALTAGVLATGGTGPTATPGRPSVAGTGSPQLRLAAAAAASGGTSYRVQSTVTYRSLPGSPSMTISGAFDPATTTGYIRIPFDGGSRWHEERLVGGDLYTTEAVAGETVLWHHDPGIKYTGLPYNVKTGGLAVSADPQQLLDTLSRSGVTITQTGPDTYHFEGAIPQQTGVTGTMVGDVTVGPDQRIAKVVYESTLRFAREPNEITVLDATLELSGYGDPVTVERPAGTFEQLPGKGK
ncbi:hypothetical protein KZZ52_37675 [Dactylosporangium sp. AC04546]|uniref:hypothetical protein n=1 Tax=Dactylosporangium sp. AC04546 TaxID=2862460 RepID=UPI001EDE5100|nr:hypothetical protein [Dactylosporangium sp. AC04546]WVK79693.1 hypothetical protein KZZ52_37675 [Dactylosporangium sp. AC04546]